MSLHLKGTSMHKKQDFYNGVYILLSPYHYMRLLPFLAPQSQCFARLQMPYCFGFLPLTTVLTAFACWIVSDSPHKWTVQSRKLLSLSAGLGWSSFPFCFVNWIPVQQISGESKNLSFLPIPSTALDS